MPLDQWFTVEDIFKPGFPRWLLPIADNGKGAAASVMRRERSGYGQGHCVPNYVS